MRRNYVLKDTFMMNKLVLLMLVFLFVFPWCNATAQGFNRTNSQSVEVLDSFRDKAAVLLLEEGLLSIYQQNAFYKSGVGQEIATWYSGEPLESYNDTSMQKIPWVGLCENTNYYNNSPNCDNR